MHHIEVSHQGARLVLEFEDDVYQPGNLTGILADIMDIKSGDRVADVGCGTGYLAIVAALLGAAEVVGIDPEPNAIHWTAHNAQLNSVPNVSVLLGGALDPVEHLRFDVILTLPPQMPFPTNFNPWRWGGTDGTDVILRIIDQARTTLHRGGRLFLLHAALADPEKVRRALGTAGFTWAILRTVEREFVPAELEKLSPGLTDYLLGLVAAGGAQVYMKGQERYYPIWFYRAVLED